MTRKTEREAERRGDHPFAYKDRLVFDALTNWEEYKREGEKINAALLADWEKRRHLLSAENWIDEDDYDDEDNLV